MTVTVLQPVYIDPQLAASGTEEIAAFLLKKGLVPLNDINY